MCMCICICVCVNICIRVCVCARVRACVCVSLTCPSNVLIISLRRPRARPCSPLAQNTWASSSCHDDEAAAVRAAPLASCLIWCTARSASWTEPVVRVKGKEICNLNGCPLTSAHWHFVLHSAMTITLNMGWKIPT